MVPPKNITEWLKKYLVYHQYKNNLHLKIRQSVSFLIHILQGSARPLSIIAICPVLKSIDSSVEQVSNIIKKLDPNKAHPHDKISIRHVKYKLYISVR